MANHLPVQPLLQSRRNMVLCLLKLATDNTVGSWSVVNVAEGPEQTTIDFASPYMLSNYPDDMGRLTGTHRLRVTVEHLPQGLPDA